MNQRVIYNFAKIIGEKFFEFNCQPGSTFDEIEVAFTEFKNAFDDLRAQAIKAEEEAKANAESAPSEAPVESEVVS